MTGIKIELNSTLGKGATATIYKAHFEGQVCAAKIYNASKRFNKDKIDAMLANPPTNLFIQFADEVYPQLAWPKQIIRVNDGHGYIMPIIDLKESFPLDYYYDSILFKKLNAPEESAISYKLEIARNLASIIADLHKHGHYFVDLKPQNIRVFRHTHIVSLLDCDGFSIAANSDLRYPAELISTDYISPEAYKKQLSPQVLGEDQDRYALAVILFQLLNNGNHPFQGIIHDDSITAPTNDEKAALGLYPYGLEEDPRISPRPQSTHELWPTATRALFDRAFIGDHKNRPSALEWAEHFGQILRNKVLVRCDKFPLDISHMRFKHKECPTCYLIDKRANSIQVKPLITKSSEVPLNLRSEKNKQSNLSSAVDTGGWVIVISVLILVVFVKAIKSDMDFVEANKQVLNEVDRAPSVLPDSEPKNVESTVLNEVVTNNQETHTQEIDDLTKNKSNIANFDSNKSESIQADYEAGVKLLNGNGVKQDLSEAVRLIKNAAEKGHKAAQTHLGVLYATGKGIQKDEVLAAYWYRKSADQGDSDAQNFLGLLYGVKQNYLQSFFWYKKSAEQGNANAQNFLGVLYENGQSVNQDYSRAFFWYKKSAEQGYALAQNNLGAAYLKGQGVKKDEVKAAYWYKKSAEQGDSDAQNVLGLLYGMGKGVKQDYSQSFLWFRKSAEQGNANAQNNLGTLYQQGRGIKQDVTKAAYWYKKSAEQGSDLAQNNLGVLYQDSLSVIHDYSEALYWYTKSADKGNSNAQSNLGSMYAKGLGVKQDGTKALYWLTKSADQNNREAEFNLGTLYGKGLGVVPDYDKAFYWYKKSAENGNPDAQLILGDLYSHGIVVTKDDSEAIKWYQAASKQGNKDAQTKIESIQKK